MSFIPCYNPFHGRISSQVLHLTIIIHDVCHYNEIIRQFVHLVSNYSTEWYDTFQQYLADTLNSEMQDTNLSLPLALNSIITNKLAQ